ncbi:TPA: putative hydroxymethylpyrimidine transporter CytX [Neisseria meningitidis]|uniref:putative hydroxymethylpyrimidine transporter CytX n=1 Tax=Neisseria meningitidis TaxID=487 RepID=UPI000C345FCD|nr:putative hydroxymethylpyrimidine transporter CytX [Neisseria meningitidis]MBH2049014.1 putative hydroxymethylpyrimidine transporter CytX [Neisseria meningitidis]MBH2082479.1 putative hydroxymethylpyrimidine transporter CytX [Neisseria meningitidis]MBH2250091.1 putative hydroxymethylpyrimidine transporter CytX [Neisseria meningitidis]MBH5611163.1 putative hydroxymethylpyrimidine transporter CytX [Neisseria meningitidis]MBH5666891.1 putative hydroxymethylpyrimidine transporter CytX [Neisseria
MSGNASSPSSSSAIGLIWFGAAVSIAEISTGTLLAPLGWQRGLAALLLGHAVGGALFFAAAYIGALTGRSSMESVRLSFGKRGSVLFSVANMLQLAGWTAVMIYAGATVSSALGKVLWDGESFVWWALANGALIVLWLVFGARKTGGLKTVSMLLMLLAVLWLSAEVFSTAGSTAAQVSDGMSFGTAVELSAVMPLSWLPLAADYTRQARRPFAATLTATLAYTLTGCWMYALGLAAALFTGETDVAKILLGAGLGAAGILAVVLSTVTTTFLDAYSAGVSANNISAKLSETPIAVAVAVVGTLLAVLLPVTEYENFLLLIGSVFAPMAAVLIADFFVLKRREEIEGFDFAGLVLWLAGFILYRFLLSSGWESSIGLTAPVMSAVAIATVSVRLFFKKTQSLQRNPS